VGIDRDPENVAWAMKWAVEAGRSNIRFMANEFDDLTSSQPFGALVGLFILMYVPDPVGTLRLLSRHLGSGAAIAFCEPDYTCYRPPFRKYLSSDRARSGSGKPSAARERGLTWACTTPITPSVIEGKCKSSNGSPNQRFIIGSERVLSLYSGHNKANVLDHTTIPSMV
jgi:hypothetical protein